MRNGLPWSSGASAAPPHFRQPPCPGGDCDLSLSVLPPNSTPEGALVIRPRFVCLFLLVVVLPHPAAAQVVPFDITSISTTNVTGTSTTRSMPESTSGVTSVTWDGSIRRLDRFVASGTTYAPALTGVVQVVRNALNGTFTSNPSTATNNPNQNSLWNYRVSLTWSSLTVHGEYVNNMATLVAKNNLYTGIENLFVNQINTGDVSVANNIERIDFIFAGGFTASAARGFALFERGLFTGGSRGNVKVAAITALSAGSPSNFSTTVADLNGASTPPWGNTNLATSAGYDVFRYRVQNDSGLNFYQDLSNSSQGIGGVFLRSSDFVPTGTTLFGFSIFARDVTATGSGLTNLANYPTTTTTLGDMDLVVTGASIYIAVPEPGTYALLGATSAILLYGWARKRGKRQATPPATLPEVPSVEPALV